MLYLSITYSMPEWIVKNWCELYGFEAVEKICQDMHEEKPTSIRCNLDKASKAEIMESLQGQGIEAEQVPYLDYALNIKNYNYMKAVDAFKKGWFQVQDVSSMLVSEIAAPNGAITVSMSVQPREAKVSILRICCTEADMWKQEISRITKYS